MNIQTLQTFIAHLRTNKLMEQEKIIRAVKAMQQLDRRIGQLAMLRGFLTPEQVSKVMLSQTQVNKKFIELAVEMGYIDNTKGDEILRLQRDELFSFAQAAVSAGVATLPEMVGLLKPFMAALPAQAAAPAGAGPGDGKPAGLKGDIRKNLQKIKGIAPLPGVVTKVSQMLDDPKTSMEAVGKVITIDPGLVTTLLRIVNSAFYGLRSQAKTVTQALVVLGTKKVKELVLVAGVMQKFKDIPPEEAARFWDRAIAAAQWCKEVGTFLKIPDVDMLFINGFIHNVGELAIYQHFPAEHEEIVKLKSSGTDPLVAERQVLGGCHADIGSFLFEIWQFPPVVIQGAMIHHYPIGQIEQMKSIKPEAMIVHLAATLTGLDSDIDPYEYMAKIGSLADPYRARLGLQNLVVEDIAVTVRDKTEEMKKMFKFE
ncbi:MAG: hypothetical protein A3G34_05445 [Candidatus Lindowbacteria bacterium RIFCSPLOWO2_12_FULL_62_27]|nr:MAG: hypothetical protein A3G34_05445 [Candidatus Lindowbacteria bacterium RIFCSPLOWO2_12_FULL_62_27]OGH63756.1 MAG: hypothetical protein A3I06_10680 [Candidatus Lindowbacteria bacterium RIFCSPLOWO2_02_FULL_62_12]